MTRLQLVESRCADSTRDRYMQRLELSGERGGFRWLALLVLAVLALGWWLP